VASDQRADPASATPFRAPSTQPFLDRFVPLWVDIRGYRLETAKRDFPAGLTVAALALPAAMAYAEVAGLSPITGLYALILPTLAYALLGTSRKLVVGPEGSISALVAAAILPLAAAGTEEGAELAAMLALLVAGFFAVAWVLRLDWIVDYFSWPVLVGYVHGVAIVLILGQMGKLLGVSVEPGSPLRELGRTIAALDEVSVLTLLVGLLALAVLIPLKLWVPRFPAALLVVVAAIGASWALDLESHNVAVIGEIPGGLPKVEVPWPPLRQTAELVIPAAGIFLVCYADEVLSARSFAGQHGQHIRARQELLAMGVVQAGSGMTGAFPVGASGSRTAVNDTSGALTQVAALVAMAATIVVLLVLTQPMQYLPAAVLGAIIVSAAFGLIDTRSWRTLWETDHVEMTIAAVTTAGVVMVGVLEALLFAVFLSVIDVVRRSARPHDAVLGLVESEDRYADVSVHPDAVMTPGVVVYRLDDRLFFANSGYFKARLREAVRGAPNEVHWVVLDGEGISHVDSTGLASLAQVRSELAAEHIGLALARFKTPILEVVRDGETGLDIDAANVHPTVRAAVEACAGKGAG
jgi:high affinity sulfate transporter 1